MRDRARGVARGRHHVATEEKDLVYRSAANDVGPRKIAPPGPTEITGEHTRSLAADPVLLFRFSALTANAHRIHYDLPYTTDVERYPALIVHGPLLALLALELPRIHRPDEPVHAFDYRLSQPVFAPARIDAFCRDGATDIVVGASGCDRRSLRPCVSPRGDAGPARRRSRPVWPRGAPAHRGNHRTPGLTGALSSSPARSGPVNSSDRGHPHTLDLPAWPETPDAAGGDPMGMDAVGRSLSSRLPPGLGWRLGCLWAVVRAAGGGVGADG